MAKRLNIEPSLFLNHANILPIKKNNVKSEVPIQISIHTELRIFLQVQAIRHPNVLK